VRKGYAQSAAGGGSLGLVLEGGILGRVDDMVVVRGVNIYPAAVDTAIRSVPGVADYQVIRSTRGAMAQLRVRVEPAAGAGGSGETAARVEAALDRAFALRIPVSLVEEGGLPRPEFKSKRWIQE
jgi:phenylacetate-CoA ligase